MTLDRLLNWFQAAVTHPDGVRNGVTSGEARRHLDIPAESVETVLTRSKSLPVLDRLAVYGHAYFARLIDCLREEYPVLKAALGEEVFDSFAVEYLLRFPSRSYTLFELGKHFPQFLRDTRPPGVGPEPAWPDFLIDLATLERTFNEVFDGPGTEGRPTLDRAAVAAAPPDRLPEVRLVPAPCLRVLSLKYPVQAYHTAVRQNEGPPFPEPADTFLAVTRQGYVVRHFVLSKPAHALLAALFRGQTLGDAIHIAVNGERPDEFVGHLGEWFRDWAAQGFFLGIAESNAPADASGW
jgi:hypothetical protein